MNGGGIAVSPTDTLQVKLQRLETSIDALLEEYRSLQSDFDQLKSAMSGPKNEGRPDETQAMMRSMEELRKKLGETEAANQQMIRERNHMRERLTHVLNRLDMIEAKLLEQRSMAAQ